MNTNAKIAAHRLSDLIIQDRMFASSFFKGCLVSMVGNTKDGGASFHIKLADGDEFEIKVFKVAETE